MTNLILGACGMTTERLFHLSLAALLLIIGCNESPQPADPISDHFLSLSGDATSSVPQNHVLLTNSDSTPTTTIEETNKTADQKPVRQSNVSYGIGASLHGRRPFPDDDPWNTRIDSSPVDPMSDAILARIGLHGHLHPDFNSGTWEGAAVGIPYIVVSGNQPKVPINYTAYGHESDPGPFPIPPSAPIERFPHEDCDKHVIVVDVDNWKLYELFRAFPQNYGLSWNADCGAEFDLTTNSERPLGWTSADAAGLPIFPGLVRYDEVGEQGEIRHALRFTLNHTRRAFVSPARHWASSDDNALLPPMGIRVRLKADYDISDYPPQARVILKALKIYGMFLADNGADWFISGTPDSRWNGSDLHTLKKVTARDLEIIKMEGLTTPRNL